MIGEGEANTIAILSPKPAATAAKKTARHDWKAGARRSALDERPGRRRQPKDQAQENGDGQNALPGVLGGRPRETGAGIRRRISEGV
jgi:hypothetical protein